MKVLNHLPTSTFNMAVQKLTATTCREKDNCCQLSAKQLAAPISVQLCGVNTSGPVKNNKLV